MTDLRAFRRACHAAARSIGATVVEFRFAEGVTPNFHQALIACRDRTVAVARATDAAVLALAEPRALGPAHGVAGSSPLSFLDVPALTATLAGLLPGCRVLTPAELDGPFDAEAWPHVSSRDIAYWRPATLGEALFNYWD